MTALCFESGELYEAGKTPPKSDLDTAAMDFGGVLHSSFWPGRHPTECLA